MKSVAISLMIVCSMLNTAGQYLFKASSSSFNMKKLSDFLKNPKIIVGLLLYVASTTLNIIALKFSDLIILYPLTNLSLVWNMVLVKRVFGEVMNSTRLVGTLLIILGCFVLVL